MAPKLAYFRPFISQQDARTQRLLLEERDDGSHSRQEPASHDADKRLASAQQGRRLAYCIVLAICSAACNAALLTYRSLGMDNPLPSLAALSNALIWLWLALYLSRTWSSIAPINVFAQGFVLSSSPFFELISTAPALASSADRFELVAQLMLLALALTFLATVLSMPVATGGYLGQVSSAERARNAVFETEPPEESGDMCKDYKLTPTSPEDFTSLASSLSYTWMTPIQQLALRRPLRPTDIFKLRSINETGILWGKFARARAEPSTSLLKALLRMSAHDALMDALWKIVGVTMSYASPALAKRILECIEEAQSEQPSNPSSTWTPRAEAFALATCAFLIITLRYFVELVNYHYARQVGMRVRIVLTVDVFDKILRKKKMTGATSPAGEEGKDAEADKASVGTVVNLIATDINNLLRMGCDLHSLYGAPIEIIVATVFLHSLLGYAAFVGIAALVIALPVNYQTGKASARLQRAYAQARDKRIALTTEALSSAQYVKLQAASGIWHHRISEARAHELRMLSRCRVLNIVITVFWTTVPLIVTLLAFYTYTIVAQETLTVAVAFTSLTLFSMLRGPLETLPTFLMAGYQAAVSLRRLERFFAASEVETFEGSESIRTEPSVNLWPGSDAFKLHVPAMQFPTTGLCLVEGSIGAGKTALLNALLNELDRPAGVLRRPRCMAYAGQSCWLEDGKSVRDNILFGSSYDSHRFKQVIEATAMQRDIDNFVSGDATHVSSATLSGGQRARLALARALYSHAPVVVLDDPLAAVDTAVQQRIMSGLLGPLTRGRLIILATHHAESLRASAKLLITVSDGLITAKEHEVPESDRHASSSAATAALPQHAEPIFEHVDYLHIFEKRREGMPAFKAVSTFFAAAHWINLVAFAAIATVSRLSGTFEQLVLRGWGESAGAGKPVDNAKFIGFYWSIVGFAAFTTTCQMVVLFRGARRASASLHDSLLRQCLGATLRWYATQPLGRILNRFVADVWVLDNDIPSSSSDILVNTMALLISTALVTYLVPTFLLPLALLVFLARNLVSGFLAASRDIQRIIATSGSPLYGRIEAALTGAEIIRSFGQQDRMRSEIVELTSAVMSQWWLLASMEVWLSVRAGIFGGAFVFAATIFCLLKQVSAGTAGVAITAASLIPQRLHMLLANYQRLIQNLNAMERIGEYLEAPQEEDKGEQIPDGLWPWKGEVQVSSVSARYAPNLPLALKDVSFSVPAGAKVCVNTLVHCHK